MFYFYIPPLEEEVDSIAPAVEDGGVLKFAMLYVSIVRGVRGTPSPYGSPSSRGRAFFSMSKIAPIPKEATALIKSQLCLPK